MLEDTARGASGCGRGTTWPVGSRLLGGSPYGVLDMAGNVSEYVAGWGIGDYALCQDGCEDPPSRTTGTMRVNRGGSYQHDEVRVRSTLRFRERSVTRSSTIGFRCCR